MGLKKIHEPRALHGRVGAEALLLRVFPLAAAAVRLLVKLQVLMRMLLLAKGRGRLSRRPLVKMQVLMRMLNLPLSYQEIHIKISKKSL